MEAIGVVMPLVSDLYNIYVEENIKIIKSCTLTGEFNEDASKFCWNMWSIEQGYVRCDLGVHFVGIFGIFEIWCWDQRKYHIKFAGRGSVSKKEIVFQKYVLTTFFGFSVLHKLLKF